MSGIDFIVYGILSTIVLIGTTEFVIGLLLIREYDKIRKKRNNKMNRNECVNCKYYEKCGKPSRPVKCMGYELKEAAVEEQNTEWYETNKTQKV